MSRRIVEKIKKAKLADKLSLAALLVTMVVAFGINVPLAYWNLQQINRSNEIQKENLEIMNMMNNFNCDITAAESQAGILYSNGFFSSNGTIESIDGFGELNIILKVVTPHYSHIAIEVGNFIDLDQYGYRYWMNEEKKNQTTISYVFENEKFEDIIGSGLTQVNATLRLQATVYPDPQQLPPKGNWARLPLGRLLLRAELYDIQTQKNFTKEFTEPMMIQISMP
ncbi:hypothetical protein MUP01_08365 [Candidatus Bathyarchaeota archaeon]|nr:hypothetical protein [Candidatus Bathyarchaeota archaeon]